MRWSVACSVEETCSLPVRSVPMKEKPTFKGESMKTVWPRMFQAEWKCLGTPLSILMGPISVNAPN